MSDGRSSYARIYDVVDRIPHGRVATYGQIASLAGFPGHARQVGYALHATPEEREIPWHRVINAKGEVSRRSERQFESIQEQLLQAEGITFTAAGRIDLRRYQWQPR